jgi:cathepsin A (carboxypeptidase C)
MKLSAFVSSLLILSSVSAAKLSFLDWVFNDQEPIIASPLIDGVNGILSQAASLFDETLDDLPELTLNAWREIELTASEKIKGLLKKSEPAEFKRRPDSDWDFHVSNTQKFPNHKLRIKSPHKLGVDDSVKQYSGYLDIEEGDKHFFFWFFESRNDPLNDPVVLWLNGGPGCSSMTGLFFELGPSNLSPQLKPIYNPYAWNSNASVIFLDEPVNVGNSYSSQAVTSTEAAGKDVYALLSLFFEQFSEYAHLPFHITGESYAGHYIPGFATEILHHEDRNFDLTSVLIGNGITNQLIQAQANEWMACGKGGYPAVISEQQCKNLASIYPRCAALTQLCYDKPTSLRCTAATIYCDQLGEPYSKTGRNVYDIRDQCYDQCYPGQDDIDLYMNLQEVRDAIGSEITGEWVGCNSSVGVGFLYTGDHSKPYHPHVAELLDNDIPVLIYAGDKDYICNWVGNRAWVNALDYKGAEGFARQPTLDWTVDGEPAGEVKNFEHFTFLRVYDAGHMVPHNQPKNSLEMLNRWLGGDYTYQ